MVSDICGRLNYAVGDGTTSAVISANSMYQHFKDESDEIKSYFFLPRNILSRLKVVTEYIAERLTRSAINIQETADGNMGPQRPLRHTAVWL